LPHQLPYYRKLLGDRYEFERVLGRGASAVVFRVRNRRLNRPEALKVLSNSFGAESVARFEAEARLVASLDHPNIVRLYDYGEVNGVLWTSMQLVEGPTLKEELQARGRFDAGTALRIARPLLDALGYSHERGIIHRDLKPANILLSREGWPYLMDFGIAKSGDSTLKTMTGSVLGTPAYMAPEQAEGRPLDGRADVYSFGLVLYHLLTGSVPFEAEEPMQLLLRRLREEPPPLRQFVPDLDAGLEQTVLGALTRQPDVRIRSAAMFAALLAGHLAKLPPGPPFVAQASFGGEPLPPSELAVRESGGEQPSTVPDPDPRRPTGETTGTRTGKVLASWLGAAAVVLAVIGGWATFAGKPQPPRIAVEPTVDASPRPADTTVLEVAKESSSASAVPSPVASPPPRRVAEPAPLDPAAADPAPAPTPRRPVRFPRLLERVEPAPSAEQAELCRGGSVVLTVQVGTDGRPTGSRVLSSPHDTCSEVARDTVAKFVFEPGADAEGAPVPAAVTLTLSFGERP
jgi:serine/threonine protein kinase